MKHIVCVFPCGPSRMVGDEVTVTDIEWSGLKDLKVGRHQIWELKRDVSTDVVEAPVEEVTQSETELEVASVANSVTVQEPETVETLQEAPKVVVSPVVKTSEKTSKK